MNKYWLPVLFGIIVFLFFIPTLFWGSHFTVGGDDSKLYYLHPQEYAKAFTTKFISNNQPGTLGFYFSQSYITPFAFLLYGLHTVLPNLNLQQFFLGLNLAFSFLCFYMLASQLAISGNFKPSKLVLTISGFLYTFSIFSYYTVWNHQLFAVYLATYVPLCLYLFSKALRDNNIGLIFLIGFISFVFSFTLFSVPWIAAILIVSIPLLSFLFFEYKSRFLAFATLTVILIAGVNLHWLVPFVYSPFSSAQKHDNISSVISKESITANENNIRAVTQFNSLLNPMALLFHPTLQESFSWDTFSVHQSWYRFLFIPNLSFLLLIIMAGFYVQREELRIKKIYSFFLLSWLIALYLFTVKVEDWGIRLFAIFNSYIPGFTMFRNMYDKFGLAMALSLALLVLVSLQIVIKKLHVTLKPYVLSFFLVLVIVNAVPFIAGSFNKLPFGKMSNTYNRLTEWNQDFLALLTTVKQIDTPSRFVWLPLNTVNYITIQDAAVENYYYMGVSPLHYLTSSNDYTGLLSFYPSHGQLFQEALEKKEYQRIGYLFQQLNIEYVIVNRSIPESVQNSYFYSYAHPADFYQLQQDPAFLESILGDKVMDFGERYSLFKINKNFSNQKIFLTEKLENFPTTFEQVTINRKDDYLFELNIHKATDSAKSSDQWLVFLDPYHDQWELFTDEQLTQPIPSTHTNAHGYANAWQLKTTDLQGLSKVYLYFTPHRLNQPLWVISGVFVAVSVSGAVFFAVRSYFKRMS